MVAKVSTDGAKRTTVTVQEQALPAIGGMDQPMWDHVVARRGVEEARPIGMGGGSRKRHLTPIPTQARRVSARLQAEADAASMESIAGRLSVRARCDGPSPVEGVLARIKSRMANGG